MRLRSVALDNTGITDDGLEHLAQLTELEECSLDGCNKLTDAALEHLAQVKTLRVLAVRGTGITAQGCQQLKGLPGLEMLILEDIDAREGDLAGLQRALPNTQIDAGRTSP